MSRLISIQTVWHSDGVPERSYFKDNFEKKVSRQQNHGKLPSMQRVNKLTNKQLLCISYQALDVCKAYNFFHNTYVQKR